MDHTKHTEPVAYVIPSGSWVGSLPAQIQGHLEGYFCPKCASTAVAALAGSIEEEAIGECMPWDCDEPFECDSCGVRLADDNS